MLAACTTIDMTAAGQRTHCSRTQGSACTQSNMFVQMRQPHGFFDDSSFGPAVELEVALASIGLFDFAVLLSSGTRNLQPFHSAISKDMVENNISKRIESYMSRSSSLFVADTVRVTFFLSVSVLVLSPHIEAAMNSTHSGYWLEGGFVTYRAPAPPFPPFLPPSSGSPDVHCLQKRPFSADLERRKSAFMAGWSLVGIEAVQR